MCSCFMGASRCRWGLRVQSFWKDARCTVLSTDILRVTIFALILVKVHQYQISRKSVQWWWWWWRGHAVECGQTDGHKHNGNWRFWGLSERAEERNYSPQQITLSPSSTTTAPYRSHCLPLVQLQPPTDHTVSQQYNYSPLQITLPLLSTTAAPNRSHCLPLVQLQPPTDHTASP